MRPEWIDEDEYPFEPREFEVEGASMSYLDEGTGEPLLFVHGTPTWSFLWRKAIRALSGDFRCVAPDHLGFGLSAKPPAADYTPMAHSRRLERLVDELGLEDITLVVHDFGGPIGLSVALNRPEKVRRIVVMNTWMWSNAGNRAAETAGRVMGSGFGRLLYRRLNFSVNALMPLAYANRSRLTRDVHRHYRAPFPGPAQRQAPWVLARELVGSNAWYEELWERRALLEGKPMLIMWGMKDRLVTPDKLRRWTREFPEATVVRLPDAGHFVQEEAPDEVVKTLRNFLSPEGGASHEVPGREPPEEHDQASGPVDAAASP